MTIVELVMSVNVRVSRMPDKLELLVNERVVMEAYRPEPLEKFNRAKEIAYQAFYDRLPLAGTIIAIKAL